VAELDHRLEVVGVAEALKVLAKADPELRKAVIKDMKAAAAPLEGSCTPRNTSTTFNELVQLAARRR
jgi:hypothetical protein